MIVQTLMIVMNENTCAGTAGNFFLAQKVIPRKIAP